MAYKNKERYRPFVCVAFAFSLSCQKFNNKHSKMKQERIDRFVTILDKKLRVRHLKQKRTNNDTPTIVFLHEGLGCIDLWKDFPNLVAEATGLDIIMYERQGHGESDPLNSPRPLNYLEVEAEVYLSQLLQQLKIDRPILIGHSDGATIALIYAALYPVSMVITAAAHVLVEEITIKGIQEAVSNYDKNNIRAKLERYHGNKANDLFWAWANTWLNPEFKSWNVTHYLPKINCPALLVQGKEDEYATLKQLHLIADYLEAPTEVWEIDNCAHAPHIQAKQRFLEKLKCFIKEHILVLKN